MLDYTKFIEGSKWRKWDLHAHTPLDPEWIDKPLLENEKDRQKFAKKYIQFAHTQNISLIAITDHNFCNDMSDLLIPYIQNEGNKVGISVLPGFEITAKDGSGIHLLVIFKENEDLNNINQLVKQLFSVGQVLIPDNGNIPASNKSIKEIYDKIKEAKLDAVMIFAHADSDNGVLKSNTITGQRRIQEWHKDFINICQLSKSKEKYESGFYYDLINDENHGYYRNDITYIVSSDCRKIDFSDSANDRLYLGEKFVWVKANPTFEGLKKLIYEPNENVKVQDYNPYNHFKKPYFSKIIINETPIFDEKSVKFKSQEIPLNRDLVTIIGSRGAGKSLLLDTINKTFNCNNRNERANKINIKKDDFKLFYKKKDSTELEFNIQNDNKLDYLHVSQSEVKDIVENPEGLDLEIKKMLGIKNQEITGKLDNNIEKIINEIDSIKKWFRVEDLDGNLINSIEYNKNVINKNEELIKTITTSSNKKLIEKYRENKSMLSNKQNYKNRLKVLKDRLDGFSDSINTEINELNSNSDECIPKVNFDTQLNNLNIILENNSNEIENFNKENSNIETEFKKAGIEGDISTLLDKVNNYQDEIEKCKNKAQEIQKKKSKLHSLFDKRNEFVSKLETTINQQVEQIDNQWNEIKKGKDSWDENQKEIINHLLEDIDIYGEVYFDDEKFYNLIYDVLNKTKFRETRDKTNFDRIKQMFKINSLEDYYDFIKNKSIRRSNNQKRITLEDLIEKDNYFINGGKREFLEILFMSHNRNKYLKVICKTKYKGKEPKKLSVGQRGTFFICLKLATDTFSTPFIYDQPEDDLDNNFIVEELVPLFKKIKKYRQVILVTHNANIVVNSNAEQVIVAQNEEEHISYVSGALECSFKNQNKSNLLKSQGIKQHVCKILEGGRKAFEKREQKYGFKK
ncbi:hypothetical protein MWH25_12060 [Natroniella acetigena]|uniref:TrlF family AAA-like ATPase n=1 Tax=Natroniella acetigena TaxID=52004 RepID=UPI00200B61D8|nr:hypothetical protein [Natroniella acetigena]MCK8828462.1 hypothetical protein [Natroniella acetigena]